MMKSCSSNIRVSIAVVFMISVSAMILVSMENNYLLKTQQHQHTGREVKELSYNDNRAAVVTNNANMSDDSPGGTTTNCISAVADDDNQYNTAAVGGGGDLNELVRNAKQIFITIPPKSAGTSLKTFVNQCMGYQAQDNFFNHNHTIESFMVENLNLPKVIAGHLYSDSPLLRILRNASKNTLIVYIHREEAERFHSAIKHVVHRYCRVSLEEQNVYNVTNGNHCEVQETHLINEIIRKKKHEVGWGSEKLLTCEVYSTIENTAPNMIFLHYKEVDKLQAAIAAHHCPDISSQHQNVAKEKEKGMNITISLSYGNKKGTHSPSLEEWIKGKGELLEWGYNIHTDNHCQWKTRHMEDELFKCSDGILSV